MTHSQNIDNMVVVVAFEAPPFRQASGRGWGLRTFARPITANQTIIEPYLDNNDLHVCSDEDWMVLLADAPHHLVFEYQD